MGPRDHYWKVLRRLDLLYNVGEDGLNQSMTIWSVDNHVRHPWFDSAVKKRKHVSLDSGCSTSSDESDAAERRPSKRRRCSILEQGLAHLSLQHNPSKNSTRSQDNEQWSGKREPTITELPQGEVAMDADDEMDGQTLAREPMLLPSSVEEPEPDIPEIQMKASSWYELAPDRIVITDLDSFESEDDNEGNNEGTGSDTMTINSSLLERLKNQKSFMTRDLVIPPTSQALVLYRPLPIPGHVPSSGLAETRPINSKKTDAMQKTDTEVEIEGGDPMDVEPMQVET